MELAAKLQLRPGADIIAVGVPADGPDLSSLPLAAAHDVDAGVRAFAQCRADLDGRAQSAVLAGSSDRLAWIAYPRAGQLGTDLNRDTLAALREHGVQPVRQVSIDAVWSALRIRPA